MTLFRRQPQRVRAHQLPHGQYPPTTRGLAKYLQESHGLEREQAVQIVRSTFSFIKTMVLDYGLEVPIYMFGTFSRRETTRNTMPSIGTVTPRQFVLKLTASQNHGRVRLEEED